MGHHILKASSVISDVLCFKCNVHGRSGAIFSKLHDKYILQIMTEQESKPEFIKVHDLYSQPCVLFVMSICSFS